MSTSNSRYLNGKSLGRKIICRHTQTLTGAVINCCDYGDDGIYDDIDNYCHYTKFEILPREWRKHHFFSHLSQSLQKVLVPLLTYRACPVPQSGGVVQGGGGGTEEEVVDVEGDVEEYEWCGGRRVRVPSLIRPQSQLLGEYLYYI